MVQSPSASFDVDLWASFGDDMDLQMVTCEIDAVSETVSCPGITTTAPAVEVSNGQYRVILSVGDWSTNSGAAMMFGLSSDTNNVYFTNSLSEESTRFAGQRNCFDEWMDYVEEECHEIDTVIEDDPIVDACLLNALALYHLCVASGGWPGW